MSDESESGSQWTQAALAAYAASAEQLVVALREHVTLTLDRAGRQGSTTTTRIPSPSPAKAEFPRAPGRAEAMSRN